MSYRCENCNEVHWGSELKIPKEIRNVDYCQFLTRFDSRTRKKMHSYNATFKGWEVKKEHRLCKECYDDLKTHEPKVDSEKSVKFFTKRVKKPLNEKPKQYKSFKDM